LKDAGIVIDTVSTDIEAALPVGATITDKAAAATDASVIKQKINCQGLVGVLHFLGKGQNLRLVGNVANMCGNHQISLTIRLTQALALSQVFDRDITQREMATGLRQLQRQLAPNTRATTSDNR
jgi:hypothetical protein